MKHKNTNHFIVDNPSYYIIYHTLLKDARVWNCMGQYWLSKECLDRAKRLLDGNTEDLKYPIKSEELFYKTKRF